MYYETQGLSDFSIAAIMGSEKKESESMTNDAVDVNDEVNVDECSDNETLSEDISRTSSCSSTSPQRIKPEALSDEERSSPEPIVVRPKIEGSCNSDDLKAIQCHLETKELWDKFDELGTEMIITKSGRRMFPTLRVSFSGPLRQSQPSDRYVVLMDIVPYDSRRYRYAYHRSSWLVAGKADPAPPPRLYAHPDTPLGADVLRRQVISFEKVKLTNDAKDGKKELIVLNSMHRYMPRIHLVRLSPHQNIPTTPVELKELHHKTFVFQETVFTAVTAYQNQLITKLKIDSNPFAKGFRDSSRLTDYDFERDPREAMMREQQLRSSFGLLSDPLLAQFVHQHPEGASAAYRQILQRFPLQDLLLLPQFYQAQNVPGLNYSIPQRQWPQLPIGLSLLPSTVPGQPLEMKANTFQRFHPYSMSSSRNLPS